MKKISLKSYNKSPLSGYLGGKYKMANTICNMIPPHEMYVEPFFGGGNIFFLKKKSKTEIINELDKDVYTFWKICKESGNELYKRFDGFKVSRKAHAKANRVLKGLDNPVDEIDLAFHVFVSVGLSFRHQMKNVTFDTTYSTHQGLNQKIETLNFMKYRLKNVVIYNKDALQIIKDIKTMEYTPEKVFLYLDPPYPETYQGHYKGYTLQDFNNLCNELKTFKGKFILSCYIKDGMDIDPNWNIKKKITSCLLQLKEKKSKRTEALIYNF